MTFNTVYADLVCPFCKQKVTSGVGFKLGSVDNRRLKLGDKLSWQGPNCRPAQRPPGGNIKSIGYFNCDNIRCESWNDCYPQVQHALVVVEDDTITAVELYTGTYLGTKDFDIIEPQGLS